MDGVPFLSFSGQILYKYRWYGQTFLPKILPRVLSCWMAGQNKIFLALQAVSNGLWQIKNVQLLQEQSNRVDYFPPVSMQIWTVAMMYAALSLILAAVHSLDGLTVNSDSVLS